MKLLLSFMLLLIMLTSCFGNKVKSNLTEEKTVEYPQLVNDRLSVYSAKDFPFAIDSSFFARDSSVNFDDGNLTIAEVKLLATFLAGDDASSREKYYLNDFYKIATAKKNGKYEKLQNSLDIGMTENAVCNSVGRLEFGDTMALVIWEILYKSYDACPFYSGHHVLGTMVRDGKVISCMQLASRESGADAPMSFEMYQLGSVSEKGIITTKGFSKTMEGDSIVETDHVFAKYRITGKGFGLYK